MNITTIYGHLTNDPQITTVKVGAVDTPVARFTVASNEWYNGKETTTFIKVTFWRGLVKIAEKLKKGSGVVLAGEISMNSYIDQSGQYRSGLELRNVFRVQFAGATPKNETATAEPAAAPAPAPVTAAPITTGEYIAVGEDGLPF